MRKKVLITGVTGFIGRYLVKELEQRGIECLGIDNVESTSVACKIEKVSLLDYDKIYEVLKEFQPDAIIHLAAIALATYENVPEIYSVNVCGTENLLRACREACIEGTRVVMISTAGVYGNQEKAFYDETLQYNPENHYSYSKMVTEFVAKQYPELDIRIVRPFNIVGVGQRNVFLIPKLVEHFAKKRKELNIGNLKPERDYVDVGYCAFTLAELALREDVDYDVYNICSGIGYSVQDVIDILSMHSGFCPQVIIDPRFIRKNEVWRLVGSPDRLLQFLNNKKCQNFNETLIQMYEYYMS